MEIVKQTQTHLQFKSNGIGLALIFFLAGILCLLALLGTLPRLPADNLFSVIYGGGLLITGSVLIITSVFAVEWLTVYTFDQDLGLVVLKWRYGLRTKIIERRLQEICCVQIDEQEDSDRSTFYVMNLVLKSGEKLCLRSAIDESDRQEYEQIANRIREFLAL